MFRVFRKSCGFYFRGQSEIPMWPGHSPHTHTLTHFYCRGAASSFSGSVLFFRGCHVLPRNVDVHELPVSRERSKYFSTHVLMHCSSPEPSFLLKLKSSTQTPKQLSAIALTRRSPRDACSVCTPWRVFRTFAGKSAGRTSGAWRLMPDAAAQGPPTTHTHTHVADAFPIDAPISLESCPRA
jgi:hypothetical protein